MVELHHYHIYKYIQLEKKAILKCILSTVKSGPNNVTVKFFLDWGPRSKILSNGSPWSNARQYSVLDLDTKQFKKQCIDLHLHDTVDTAFNCTIRNIPHTNITGMINTSSLQCTGACCEFVMSCANYVEYFSIVSVCFSFFNLVVWNIKLM